MILEELSASPAAAPVRANALLHLGNRAAVDQALSRLAREGRLLRIRRGMYVQPTETRFGAAAPPIDAVLGALQAETGETIASSGAAAANALGLSTQVPVRSVYLTSGPSRVLRFGAQTVELRRAPRWQLTSPGRPAGDLIRALAWFGRERASGIVNEARRVLSKETMEELAKARGRLPQWMAEQISMLVAGA